MFAILCGIIEWKHICASLLLFVFFICIAVGDPFIMTVWVAIPLTDLTQPHFYACPKPVFFVFSIRGETYTVVLEVRHTL